jgi:hypothetical protein
MDKFFKDRHGKVKVWQTPNLPLMLWAVATAANMVARHGSPHKFFDVVAFGAIFTWAYLEVRTGDSWFRRVLGALVLIVTVYNRIR